MTPLQPCRAPHYARELALDVRFPQRTPRRWVIAVPFVRVRQERVFWTQDDRDGRAAVERAGLEVLVQRRAARFLPCGRRAGGEEVRSVYR